MLDSKIKFIQQILKSTLSVESVYLEPPYSNISEIDLGLRRTLFSNFDYMITLLNLQKRLNPTTVYCYYDSFNSYYAILRLPSQEDCYLAIGPYLLEESSERFLNQVIEKNQLTNSMLFSLQEYYHSLPVLDSRQIISTINDIAAYIYGGINNYIVEFRNNNWMENDVTLEIQPNPELTLQIDVMETRYELENNLLQAVGKGNRRKSIECLKNFTAYRMETRSIDSLRDLKNQAIILNTLYRKTAENNYVHPVYLNDISKKYSIEIEQQQTERSLQTLILDMTRKYCLLIQTQSLKNYSPLIRKSIDYINLNLSSPLNLRTLAEQFSVNASYLSTLFRKEMNITLTDYINHQRINTAIQLLNSSDMAIQNIAWHVGIPDVNYFSRLFKKIVGVTPSQYKKEILS